MFWFTFVLIGGGHMGLICEVFLMSGVCGADIIDGDFAAFASISINIERDFLPIPNQKIFLFE